MADAVLRLQIWLAVAHPNRRDDRGASLVEYALLIALIALICFAAVGFLGEEASSRYANTGSSFND